jgi:hypothetical protein
MTLAELLFPIMTRDAAKAHKTIEELRKLNTDLNELCTEQQKVIVQCKTAILGLQKKLHNAENALAFNSSYTHQYPGGR